MTNNIMDTGNVAELLGMDDGEDMSSMEARKEPEGNGIEFHVAMTSWTLRDMEELIVQAAANQIVGRLGKDSLAKEIETRTIALVTAKADKALEAVTTEIIDQPVFPRGYTYGKPQGDPVTMREFIGLTGRQYLAERVDNYGKVNERPSYNEISRISYLVQKSMDAVFEREIKAATNAAVAEIKAAIADQHKAFLDAEKARFRQAIAQVTA